MLIDDFNHTLQIWLRELNKYDYKKIIEKPEASSWSIGQVYMHLIDETTWYFGQISLCFDDLEHPEKEMSESAKLMFQNNSFPDLQIKGDPIAAANISQPIDIPSLKLALEKLKDEANVLWAKMELKKTYGKSKHPGLHYLSPKEWLQFSEMHMRHHLKQKNNIVAALNFKKKYL